MKVVSNSSPLIGLAHANRLPLLHALCVPAAVWNEGVVHGVNQLGAVAQGSSIRQANVENTPLVLSLTQDHLLIRSRKCRTSIAR